MTVYCYFYNFYCSNSLQTKPYSLQLHVKMGETGEKTPGVQEHIRHGPCTLPVMTHLLVLPVIYDSEKLYDCSEPQIESVLKHFPNRFDAFLIDIITN